MAVGICWDCARIVLVFMRAAFVVLAALLVFCWLCAGIVLGLCWDCAGLAGLVLGLC